jgi:hypothetical protein
VAGRALAVLVGGLDDRARAGRRAALLGRRVANARPREDPSISIIPIM